MKKRIFGSVHTFLEPGAVFGRTVASESFFRALLSVDPFDEYRFFLYDPKVMDKALPDLDLAALKRGAVKVYPKQKLVSDITESEFFCFHMADPFMAQTGLVFLRNRFSSNIFPITCVPHTLSYSSYAQDFLHELWPGISSRDALLATSNAAVHVLEAYYQQLRTHYRLPDDYKQPTLRLLPLGVDLNRFTPPSGEERQKAREHYHLLPEEICCLVHGRITVDDKMDLLPLLYAAKRVLQEENPPQLHLIFSGKNRENDSYPKVLEATAKAAGITLSFSFSPTNEELTTLYHAADIFLSPSDNLQETFGLTILEAAASSLPCIASDWDGYRDLVRHGETGLLIPTLAPRDTPFLNDIAYFVPDNIHQLLRAQQTVVDVPGLAHALSMLARNETMRREMGEHARRLVEENYSWETIVARWVALIEELNELPLSTEEEHRIRTARHPSYLDIAKIFARHPSRLLDTDSPETDTVLLTARGTDVLRGKEAAVTWPGTQLCFKQVQLRKMLTLARRPITLTQLASRMTDVDNDKESVQFVLLWALKHDLLERCESSSLPS